MGLPTLEEKRNKAVAKAEVRRVRFSKSRSVKHGEQFRKALRELGEIKKQIALEK